VSIGRDGKVQRQLTSLFHLGTVGGLTDGQLLERFMTGPRGAAEGAFAALIDRHGPMVWHTCWGVLADPHDAQDAFQATFLVLIEKARGLWVQDSLGPWLHQVAYRTASAARSASIRRREHERRRAASATVAVSPAGEGAGTDGEWERRVLHEEIARLPERYRVPMVLCGLEGLTHEQAAQRLRWPVGTVKSRLARGRERLQARLTRKGLAPAIATSGSPHRAETGSGAMPAATKDTTVRVALAFAAGEVSAGAVPASVVTLARKVLSTMFLTKAKGIAIALLGAGVVAGGATGLAFQAPGDQAEAVRTGGGPKPKAERPDTGPDLDDARKRDSTTSQQVPSRDRADDEIELLEAQLEAKRAELRGAEALMERAAATVAHYNRLTAKGPDYVSKEEMRKANSEVAFQEAQRDVKQAEIREAEARLRQARRPRAHPEGLTERSGQAGNAVSPASLDRRMTEMERKLDQMIGELQGLRRDLRRDTQKP